MVGDAYIFHATDVPFTHELLTARMAEALARAQAPPAPKACHVMTSCCTLSPHVTAAHDQAHPQQGARQILVALAPHRIHIVVAHRQGRQG